MAEKAKSAGVVLEIPSLKRHVLRVVLIGDAPLIMHQWSAKAKTMILEKQQKKASKGKEIRNPERDYEESMYRLPDSGYCFPAVAFKAAAVTVCSQIDGISKVFARQTFHVEEEWVRIYGTPRMREDMVRVGMGTADLRYRAEFPEWVAEFHVTYNAAAISEEQLRNLFNTAGFGVGVGEWRPEKDGRYGRFHIATVAELEDWEASRKSA